MQYRKVKDAAKKVVSGVKARELVLRTLKEVAQVVGATLGPGGVPILLERQELGLPPHTTKDGVTVIRSLSFEDPAMQEVLEVVRDIVVKTANEAGDGTTTATVLAAAMVEGVVEYCDSDRRTSPQVVTRRMLQMVHDDVVPFLGRMRRKITPSSTRTMLNIASVSANGDKELAKAVVSCFAITGDAGNVTIAEGVGEGYSVDKVEGYTVANGWDCLGTVAAEFLTDGAGQRVVLEKPVFLVYNGRFTEVAPLYQAVEDIATTLHEGGKTNVVVVAHEFSDRVLAHLAANFSDPKTLNLLPLVASRTAMKGSELQQMLDLCAITGATLLSPLDGVASLSGLTIGQLGPGVERVEMVRHKTTVVGMGDGEGSSVEDAVMARAYELEQQRDTAGSEYERTMLQCQLAALTGGIARLTVKGRSVADTKERADRAEDAVCAVRSALSAGSVPGGGWALLRAGEHLTLRYKTGDQLSKDVAMLLTKALLEPLVRMVENSGASLEELDTILRTMYSDPNVLYDLSGHKFVDKRRGGVLDSFAAVQQAVKNAASLAVLGTIGGIVVFPRDDQVERQESESSHEYVRTVES